MSRAALVICISLGVALLAVAQLHNVGNTSNLGALTLGKGSDIACATTIAPVSYVTHVTGVCVIDTITVPTNFPLGGTIILIPDAIWTTVATGNIALATTGVVNKALILVWDGTKWTPSY